MGTELELDATGGRELPSLTPWDDNDQYIAKGLLVKYTEWLPKARRRKSTPAWGFVTELMHMVLRPGDGAELDRGGLGCDASPPDNSTLRGALHAIVRQVHAGSRAPSHATFGLSAPIPKGNDRTGMQASRWITMMCQAWGGLLRMMKSQAGRPIVPSWLYGAQPHRRREGAVLVQHVAQKRVAAAG